MPKLSRQRSAPTDDWQQLHLKFAWPEQTVYELIRPVVLFGRTAKERADETGENARRIYTKADQFDAQGMLALFAPETPPRRETDKRTLPTAIWEHIRELKAEHGAFHPNEIATICYVKFGQRPSPHTVQRVLADDDPPPMPRRFPPYTEIADPAERRLALIRLHAEGWNIKTISAYMQVNRSTVYATLKRWVAEGVAGLEDKPRARKGVRKVDLKTVTTVRKLQENPELGEWRIHAALRQLGIRLSPRTCGRILSLNRKLYGLRQPAAQPHTPKPMPFKADRRHQYWSVDVRYIEQHQLGDKPLYVISILENFSRAILASAISRSQDSTAYLMVFYAAIRQHGTPEALVSDSGAIFLSNQAKDIYTALGIEKKQIAKKQAWQNYIEANWNIQRRMADFHFAHAATWDAIQDVHAKWVADFNYQVHWAHRERTDNRHSPAEVLGWVQGTVREPGDLDRIFHALRFKRKLRQNGYVQFRHWLVYGELGLAKKMAVVWLYKETLTVEFGDQPLSQYTLTYQPDATHIKHITEPQIFETQFKSPQLALWPQGEVEWHAVLRQPDPAARRKKKSQTVVQPQLFETG